jgi:hypothetical protein
VNSSSLGRQLQTAFISMRGEGHQSKLTAEHCAALVCLVRCEASQRNRMQPLPAKRVAMHYCRTVCSPCLPNALQSITTEPDAALVCLTRRGASQRNRIQPLSAKRVAMPYRGTVCSPCLPSAWRLTKEMYAALVCVTHGKALQRRETCYFCCLSTETIKGKRNYRWRF